MDLRKETEALEWIKQNIHEERLELHLMENYGQNRELVEAFAIKENIGFITSTCTWSEHLMRYNRIFTIPHDVCAVLKGC